MSRALKKHEGTRTELCRRDQPPVPPSVIAWGGKIILTSRVRKRLNRFCDPRQIPLSSRPRFDPGITTP
jgi:hypothetical protein